MSGRIHTTPKGVHSTKSVLGRDIQYDEDGNEIHIHHNWTNEEIE